MESPVLTKVHARMRGVCYLALGSYIISIPCSQDYFDALVIKLVMVFKDIAFIMILRALGIGYILGSGWRTR